MLIVYGSVTAETRRVRYVVEWCLPENDRVQGWWHRSEALPWVDEENREDHGRAREEAFDLCEALQKGWKSAKYRVVQERSQQTSQVISRVTADLDK